MPASRSAAAAVRGNCVRAAVVRRSPSGINLTRARAVACCIMNERSRALSLERLISSALAQGVVVSVAPDKKGRRVITDALSGVERPAGSHVRSDRASVRPRRRRRRQRRSWVQVISTPMRDQTAPATPQSAQDPPSAHGGTSHPGNDSQPIRARACAVGTSCLPPLVLSGGADGPVKVRARLSSSESSTCGIG